MSAEKVTTMARQRMDYNFLSPFANSVESIRNDFNNLDDVSAKLFYTDILKAVQEAISHEKIDSLRNLSRILDGLKNFQQTDDIGHFNLVSLACKYKAITALEYIFSEESQTLYKLSINLTGVSESELFSVKDEFRHDAFYYAIRSNKPDLLNSLIDKWRNQYSGEDLDDLLSNSYKDLKLRNVSLTTEMQLFVQSKILDLRFFDTSTAENSGTGNSWDQIKKRIKLVVEYIQSIKNDYWDADPDERFMHISEFIAKNIHVLKSLLKSTYDKLPWEEIEFCLVIFIRCCKSSSESNLIYNCVLNKKQLLMHLFNFSVVLDNSHDKFKNSNVIKLSKSVNLQRDSVIAKITEKNRELRELYNDYEKIRDFSSLEILKSYSDLIESSDTEKQRHLLVSRVLQVMGEHLRNTLESPKLSIKTADAFLSSLSSNTREVIMKLRDALSHKEALIIRSDMEKKLHLFNNIVRDISKIRAAIPDFLYAIKIASIKILMQKVKLCESTKDIKDCYGPYRHSIDIYFKEVVKINLVKGDFERLEELILCLDDHIKDKTLSEKILFDGIHRLIRKEKNRFESLKNEFQLNVKAVSHLNMCASYESYSCEAIHKMAKGLSESHFEIPSRKFEPILKLLHELIQRVILRISPTENMEESDILLKIHAFLNFEMGSMKWIEEFRDLCQNAKDSRKKKLIYNLPENLLNSKLSILKETLIDFDSKNCTSSAEFSFFEKNMKLRAITEMLVLDILSILESSCSRNPFFLDGDYPLLNGRNLRNHLAHGNALIDVCVGESSAILFVCAKKLLAAVLSKNNKMDRVIRCDCIKLESAIEQDLRIISYQQKLFEALGEGNMKDCQEYFYKGADVYGRDCNFSTCLHIASKAPDIAAVNWILKDSLRTNVINRDGESLLHIAAKFNRVQIMRHLVEKENMSLLDKDINGKTPLHVAVEKQSTEVIEYISNFEICTTRKDRNGYIPLHIAIFRNDIAAVNILFGKETNVDKNKSNRNYTSLLIATLSKNLDFVKLLIAKKANVDSKCDFGHTSLHLATLTMDMEIVKVLIANGADVNAKNEDGNTPLQYAAALGIMEIVEFLINKKADVNAADNRQFTPLMVAAINGHTSIVQLLLDKGALVNSKESFGCAPLHFAADKGHYEIVELLLNHKAIIDCKSNENGTPLYFSARGGHKEIVKLLLKEGADVNAPESANSIALHQAAALGDKDIVDMLIDKGADINLKDEAGSTALHHAASNTNGDIVKSLVKKGADIRTINTSNITPLFILISRGLSNLPLPELRDVNSADANGFTLLHLSAAAGDKALVEYCIENKCDVNARNNYGLTALHLAASENHQNIVSFLLNKGAEIDGNDQCGVTPLLLSVVFNCKDTLEILISHGTNELHSISNDKIEALRYSVSAGKSDTLDLLFQKYKFNINELPQDLLEVAVCGNHRRVVAVLLSKGFEVNADVQPLHIAVRNKHYEMAEFLLANGANPMLLDEDNLTPLQIASAMGDAEMVEILLSQTTDIRIENDVIFSAAELAVGENQLDVIKVLLHIKVIDVNARGKSSFTLLHISAHIGSLETTKYLVAEGADINARDNKNRMPVYIAAEKGFKDIVEFYLNCKDLGEEIAELLLIAVSKGKADVCELLIERNTDVNACHADGEIPFNLALKKGHKEVLSVLLHYGAYYNANQLPPSELANNKDVVPILTKVKEVFTAVQRKASDKLKSLLAEEGNSKYCLANAKCVKKGTVLHYASWNGYQEIVDILLKHNTNPNTANKTGCTPLHYAVKYSHFKIVKSLLSNGAIFNALSQSGKTPLEFATDRKIRDFLLFIRYIFKKVQDNDPSVLENLKGKNEDVMRAVIRAKNQKGKTLLDVAYIYTFSKIDELQKILENEYHSLESAQKSVLEERYDEAFLIYESILRTRVAVFGQYSQPVLDVKIKQAKVHEIMENFGKALNLFEDVYQTRKRVLGESHKQTLYAKTCIGQVLSKQGEKLEALNTFKAVDIIQKETAEPDDFDVLYNELGLSAALYEMNRFHEAFKIIIKIEEKCSQKGKRSRIEITEPLYIKAMIFSKLGKYSEALELFQSIYETRKNIFSPHHSDTLDALLAVACTLYLQEKFDESHDVFRKVLDIQKSFLPEDHINILETQLYIADVLSKQELDVTAQNYFSSLEPRIAALGPNSGLMFRTS
ncbi:unnamed protein product [Larinioides sclopetarius]|uniref:Alpha-latrotoxin n=1 Tax=Larinioides sclopetarius TaxID=280406 RepID=A0AAV2APU3_9ARAC